MHLSPALYRTVLLLDWLIALAWLWRVLLAGHMLGRIPDLTRGGCGQPSRSLPRLTVIVPARNEAENIAATLRSLLDSAGVALEILAVDDRSEDETGAIMDAIARDTIAQDAMTGESAAIRVLHIIKVLHIQELPAGWLGKTHAMATAARQAAGEWLLFTDGDVLFHPDALGRALAFAAASEADHVVLLPTILLRSWSERMMVAFLQVMSLWALRPWRIADPKARRDSIGVGAFNLIRREVYDSIGGWEALRMEVLEDLALGRRVKQRGFRQRVVLGRGLVSVRWARGAFGVVGNLTKNLFALFRFRPERLLGFTLGLALFTLLPPAAFLMGGAMRWPVCVMVFALVLAYRRAGYYHHFSAAQVLLFPAASLLMLYTLLYSMLLVLARGGISWRGTFYPLRELRKQGGEKVE